ncbi:UNVERIFIED_ORG: type II secretion system protein E [Clostridium botulinum]
MNNAALFFNTGKNIKEFPKVLQDVQEYISNKYSNLISDNPEEQREQIKSYISKYIMDYSLGVEGLSFDELIEKIYSEMAEFSFLTKYLFRKDVEEININQWKDIKITYTNGEILPTKDKFNSPEHAIDVLRRLLHKSGMILDNSQPIVRGHLSNKIRITVFGTGVIDDDKGISASIRIVNPQKLSKEDFVNNGTATEEMLDFLSICLRYGISMCATGATSSGKTTLMSWLLSTIPDDKRIFTIENGTREFDLVKTDKEGNVINNVVHTVTRYSEDKKQNIEQEKLLESALTFNPDYICVAEMKGEESFAAQEAARTGHAVITTTHANSCEATYFRMMTLCKMKYDINDETLYSLVTEAFPIVLFTKKLEDNSRKIMEITECEILPNGKRKIHTLFRYHIKENKVIDDKVKIIGYYEKINDISKNLQKRLLENGMPLSVLKSLLNQNTVKEGEVK